MHVLATYINDDHDEQHQPDPVVSPENLNYDHLSASLGDFFEMSFVYKNKRRVAKKVPRRSKKAKLKPNSRMQDDTAGSSTYSTDNDDDGADHHSVPRSCIGSDATFFCLSKNFVQ